MSSTMKKVVRSVPTSPNVTPKDYCVEPMLLPRLQRRLSATKKCQTCNKIVYFTGIRCKLCGYIAHESCSDRNPHVCDIEGLRKRQPTAFLFTPEAISATQSGCSVSAPVSPKTPRSPMSPTEFLRTAFSWMKLSKKTNEVKVVSTPKKETKEERASTWSSPDRVEPVIASISNEESDNAVSEWCIPSKDLEFEKCVRSGRDGAIYEGRWHGDVSIHTFNKSQDLWSQVNRLMQVRHENCSLFMGACIERSKLAIVTSPSNGSQIYDVKGQLSVDEKLSVAAQVVNGMSYLHAKGLVHGKLNTKNVNMEKRRAKISLLDQSFPELRQGNTEYGCFSKNTLASWAPELVKKIYVRGNKVSSRHPFTRAADVYAFGSFLYELFTEELPFAGMSTEEMLFKIGSGCTPDLNKKSIPRPIRDLIARCWSAVPQERPTFKQISCFFQEKTVACSASIRGIHSTSTPNRLDLVGLGLAR